MILLAPSRKDDREEPLPFSVAPAPAPTADEYRGILIRHRKLQLRHTSESVQRLAQTYDRAIDVILERVRALPDGVARTGTGWLQAQLQAVRSIREELDRLRTDYATMLDMSMLGTAQDAADREAEVARLVGAPTDPRMQATLSRSYVPASGVELGVQYGSLAKEAVEVVANRYYRDGLKLSQRLYNLSAETQKVVEDAIVKGIAAGTSARDLAKELQGLLSAEGKLTPRYNAMRIARTEIRTAHVEGHIRSTMRPGGELKSYITGIRWSLSLSHPAADVCDCYATHDEGNGPGIFAPGTTPVSHPHCLCNTTTALVYFPEIGPNGKTPDVAAVPQSQLEYYSRLGDKPAAAALAARGA